MKFFGRELVDYLKPVWPWLLAVALIGQFQVLNVFFFHIQALDCLPLGFLHFTQLLWALIIAFSVLHIVRKKNFSFPQALFVGFLYIIAFGVLKVIARIAMGHDIHYLFFGDAQRMGPFLECILYISGITIIAALGGMLDKKTAKKKVQ